MKKEKISLYASLAEIVSALAVVLSLLYVSSEFRRSQMLSSRDVDVILYDRASQANKAIYESADLANLIIKAQMRADTLSAADRLRYLSYQHDFFDSWEIAWIYHQNGILDEASWKEWDQWYARKAKLIPKFGWIENQNNFTGTAFHDYVSTLLKED